MLLFLIVLALYIPYFFLPVFHAEGYWFSGTAYGWQAFIVCLRVPVLWPVIVGHVAIWVGSVALLRGRWDLSWKMGVLAFWASFWSWIILVLQLSGGQTEGTWGLWAKLLCITTLVSISPQRRG